MMRGNLIGSIGRITPRLETLESRLTPDASAQAVVTGLYHQVLLREPDAAGLAAHTRALERGATPAEVAGALYFSHEFRQAQTQRFFENLLGRDGDQAGLDNWVDHLIDGLPEETVAAAMASSTLRRWPASREPVRPSRGPRDRLVPRPAGPPTR